MTVFLSYSSSQSLSMLSEWVQALRQQLPRRAQLYHTTARRCVRTGASALQPLPKPADGDGSTSACGNVPGLVSALHPSPSPSRSFLHGGRFVFTSIYSQSLAQASRRVLAKKFPEVHLCEVKHKCEHTYTVITTSPQGPYKATACTEKLLADFTCPCLKKPQQPMNSVQGTNPSPP